MLNIKRLSTLFSVFIIFLVFVIGAPLTAVARQAQARTAEEILRSFVADFKTDPAAAEPNVFGVRVQGGENAEWQVAVLGKKAADGSYEVDLTRGLPSNPSFIYTLDAATLRAIDAGEINALTAMGRARMSDPAPMDVEFMPGFQPDASFLARFLPFTFHFWTQGFPEAVPFAERNSREVHGANMVVLYYQEGLRSAWGRIAKGQHVNKDPDDQVNPFPTMMIAIRGKAMARIGGKEVPMEAGQMTFIPAGVSHEAWNPYDEPAEVIILMFGEGA